MSQKQASTSLEWINPLRTGRGLPKQNLQIEKSYSYQILDKPGTVSPVEPATKSATGEKKGVLTEEDRIRGNLVTLAEIMEFRNCVDYCGLIELPHQRNRYTWNDKHSEQKIFSKIDWAFINDKWLGIMPTYQAKFLPEGISDHCPMQLTLEGIKTRKKKSFQYCNVWDQHPLFDATIKAGWEVQIEWCKILRVVKRLRLLKKGLKQLNSKYFKDLVNEVDDSREELRRVQEKMQANPLDKGMQKKEREVYQQFRRISYMAEIYLQQKSKANWIRLGDDNTMYFYAVIKHRRMKLATTQIREKQGKWQSDPDDIAQVFVEYYENLLGHTINARVKSYQQLCEKRAGFILRTIG
ncbi:uncharacterized protein LOC107804402 [Nicotiana tabacum]|uniref:Uncharacterized protein LOC107804402 n=1 Tax=Nicotiana tabacum TaxID=4097 RepID=A0A1S4B4B6_TOBAC